MVRKVPNTDGVTFFSDTDWEETVVCLWVVSMDCVVVSDLYFLVRMYLFQTRSAVLPKSGIVI